MSATLLERLLAPGALTAHFQPVVDLSAGAPRIFYLEGLLRVTIDCTLPRPEVLFSYARRKHSETALDRAALRAVLGAGTLAVVTSSGFLIVNALAEQWIAAYAAERTVLANLRERVPSLPPGSTLLLSGTCPYIGPAIVFEADWDLAGALQVLPFANADSPADTISSRRHQDDGAGLLTRNITGAGCRVESVGIVGPTVAARAKIDDRALSKGVCGS